MSIPPARPLHRGGVDSVSTAIAMVPYEHGYGLAWRRLVGDFSG